MFVDEAEPSLFTEGFSTTDALWGAFVLAKGWVAGVATDGRCGTGVVYFCERTGCKVLVAIDV